MFKQFYIFLISIVFITESYSQTIESIFTDINTISFSSGVFPGEITISDPNTTAIIGSSCGNNLKYSGVISTFGNGKIMGLSSDKIATNTALNLEDNELFLNQAINWLSNANNTATVVLKEGVFSSSNSSFFKSNLETIGYTFNYTTSAISFINLANTDVLILGNDWNNSTPYTSAELNILKNFVSNGGSILILADGGNWNLNISDYPMNNLANEFGFQFTENSIEELHFTNTYPVQTDLSGCFSPYVNTNIKRGKYLREYRIAVSVTGEYSSQAGGLLFIKNQMNEWLKEINTIFGREYSVRFKLIANNDQLIFTNPNTDPWETIPVGSSGCDNAELMNNQKQVFDSIIGAQNYDISHVIHHTNNVGGGCAGSFTFGYTGGFSTSISRHEIGHQFGQPHLIGNPDMDNYEIEDGNWSIQGGNGYGYAHAQSYHRLALTVKNKFNVGEKITTNNFIPTIDAGKDYIIPKKTPFKLTANAIDTNTNDALTYVWDNMNKGIVQSLPLSDDGQGALFMRLLPTEKNYRIFPKIDDVLNDIIANNQEQLPTKARDMHIRVTVNDNHKINYFGETINASGINSDDLKIKVADSGPFRVTSQASSGLSFFGNTNQEITWDVNNTDLPPVSTAYVKISLSLDGGYTFPIVLNDSTLNDGSEIVHIPFMATTKGRIKVEALSNIYFDINSTDFEIRTNIGLSDLANNFSVYPNPSKEFVHIQSKNTTASLNLKLIDISGKKILIEENSTKMNISAIKNGIYLLEITDKNDTFKIIKKVEILK